MNIAVKAVVINPSVISCNRSISNYVRVK